MSMTPMSSLTASNSSSALYKDLTSSLFDPNSPQQTSSSSSFPSQSLYGMTTSQTMPSLIRPTITPQQPSRPAMNFSSSSSSSKTTDLTSSLLNNINSLGSRPQTSPSTTPMNANSSIPTPYFNSNPGTLFQPPPPPGSTVIRGSITPANAVRPKSAASELDDLFN